MIRNFSMGRRRREESPPFTGGFSYYTMLPIFFWWVRRQRPTAAAAAAFISQSVMNDSWKFTTTRYTAARTQQIYLLSGKISPCLSLSDWGIICPSSSSSSSDDDNTLTFMERRSPPTPVSIRPLKIPRLIRLRPCMEIHQPSCQFSVLCM